MKTLLGYSLSSVAGCLHSPHIGPRLHLLPPQIKLLLLELVLSHDLLTKQNWPHLVKKAFFADLRRLILPRSDQMNDEFMNTIAASGCQLSEIYLAVPMIPTDERRAKLTGGGVSALLGTQDALEVLTLIWCVNFKQGVLNRIRSDRLKIVEIHGDAICSCFTNSGYVLRDDEVQLYQRDISFLAINNRTITHLHLDSVILNLADCHSLFSALSDSLEHLTIKIVRYYAYCENVHCFYGRDFIPFMEMVDSKCPRLQYFSCFCYKPDWQQNRQLVMQSNNLHCLSLEGHVFDTPVLLPCNLRKLKLSLNGSENSQHFTVLCSDRLPNLDKLYIHLVENYTVADESGLTALFADLGPKIVSITDINAVVFNQFAFFICEFCPNLKSLGILHLVPVSFTGFQLLPLFGDAERACKLKHLRLTIDHASQALLSLMAANCSNLRTLDVAYCRAMDDALLSQLAINCAHCLRILEISYCQQITDDGVRAIAVNCSSTLEEICMLGASVGDEAVLALAACCPSIKVCRFDTKAVSGTVKEKVKGRWINRVIGVDI